MIDILEILEAFHDLKELAGATGALEDAPLEKRKRIAHVEKQLQQAARLREHEKMNEYESEGLGL